MYNTGRFNLIRYNLRSEEREEVSLNAYISGRFLSLIRRGENIHTHFFITAATETRSHVGAGSLVAARLADAVGFSAKASTVCPLSGTLTASLLAAVQPTMDVLARAYMPASLGARLTLNSVFHMAERMREDFQGAAGLAMTHHLRAVLAGGTFSSQVTTSRFGITYAVFDLTIPPGGTLVIDSDGYVVLLNGEDVIHAHSGDWLRLSRKTFDVLVENTGGGGQMDKQILYQERWL